MFFYRKAYLRTAEVGTTYNLALPPAESGPSFLRDEVAYAWGGLIVAQSTRLLWPRRQRSTQSLAYGYGLTFDLNRERRWLKW